MTTSLVNFAYVKVEIFSSKSRSQGDKQAIIRQKLVPLKLYFKI